VVYERIVQSINPNVNKKRSGQEITVTRDRSNGGDQKAPPRGIRKRGKDTAGLSEAEPGKKTK